MMVQRTKTMPGRVPFGSSLSARLACLTLRRFCGRSRTLVVPIPPWFLPAFVLAGSALPHGSAYRFPGGYVVPGASHRAVASSACPGRERLMEQSVSSAHRSSVKQKFMRLAGRTFSRSRPALRRFRMLASVLRTALTAARAVCRRPSTQAIRLVTTRRDMTCRLHTTNRRPP